MEESIKEENGSMEKEPQTIGGYYARALHRLGYKKHSREEFLDSLRKLDNDKKKLL